MYNIGFGKQTIYNAERMIKIGPAVPKLTLLKEQTKSFVLITVLVLEMFETQDYIKSIVVNIVFTVLMDKQSSINFRFLFCRQMSRSLFKLLLT